MNKSPDKRFVAKFKDGSIRPIPARCFTIANAVVRLHAGNKKYNLKEVKQNKS